MKQRWQRWLSGVAAGGLLFILFVWFLFPVRLVDQAVGQALASGGLTLASSGIGKVVPLGVRWKDMVISSPQGGLVRFDRLTVRLHVLRLLTGRVVLGAEGEIGSGRITVEYTLRGQQGAILSAEGISLADIPFFSSVLGAKAGGSVRSEGKLMPGARGLSGELKLETRQLAFSGMKLGAFPLPDVSGLTSQGMLRVTEGRGRLESFSLQGEGIYMRLSGDVPSGPNVTSEPLNLTLEIMPKPEFMEKQKFVFLVLTKFMASPGNYRIPIRGTLLKPEIL